jgi:hypothetical protein
MSAFLDSLSSNFVAGKFEWYEAIQFIVKSTVATGLIFWLGKKIGIFQQRKITIQFPEKGTGSNYSCILINNKIFQLQDCEVKITILHNEQDVRKRTQLNDKSGWDTDGVPYINQDNLKIVKRETLPYSDDTAIPVTKKNINRNDGSNFDVLDVKDEWNFFRIFSEKKYTPPRVYLKKKQYSGIIHVSARNDKGNNFLIAIDPNNEKYPIKLKSSNIFVKFRNWICGHVCKNSYSL